MRLEELNKLINQILPPQTAMEGDRIGIQIQNEREEINSILVTLEVNDEVAEEAVKRKCDCIISFHPLIYRPLKNINLEDRVGRLTSKLIKNDTALITIHTTFDAYLEGTSKILADKLGFKIESFLVADEKFENRGMGVIASPENPVTKNEILGKVSDATGSPLRYSEGKSGMISRVAIVGGSGTSFMDAALESGVDAFITADITYHTFHAMHGKMMLIDPGHYEMEQFVPLGVAKLLVDTLDREKKEYNKVLISKVRTNPVNYYPDNEKYVEMQNNYLLTNH